MRIALVFVMLAALALSACTNSPGNSNTAGNGNVSGNSNARGAGEPFPPLVPKEAPDPNFKNCNPYFALVPGSRRVYTISYSSGLVATATVIVDRWNDSNGKPGFNEKTQIVDSSGGYKIKQAIERHYVCDGEKVAILYEKTDSDIEGQKTSTEFFYRDNSYMMIEPSGLKPQASWQLSLKSKMQKPGEAPSESPAPVIINYTVERMNEEIELPTGKVKALLVTRKVGAALINDYFVPGLGFVRRNAMEGNKWELKEYSGMKPE